jgi:surface antigen
LFGKLAGDMLGSQLSKSGISSSTLNSMRSFLGDAIACSLNDAERKKAANSQTTALDSGKTGEASASSWASDDRPGVRGTTRVTSRSKVNGNDCAVTATVIVDENGDEKSVNREVCHGPNGWA